MKYGNQVTMTQFNTQPQALSENACRLSLDFINDHCMIYVSTKLYTATEFRSFCLFLDRKNT